MKSKKVLACLMAGAMVLSLAACGSTEADGTPAETPAVETTAETPAETPAEPEAPAEEVKEDTPKSITFDEGSISFLGQDSIVNPTSDASLIELGDYNGDSAAVITPQGKKPFVAIQMDQMVGDKVADVASVELTMATKAPDGAFHATSGKIYQVRGEDKSFSGVDWSIYMEKQLPKTVSAPVEGAVAGDYIVVSLESDVAADEGAGQSTLYLLDVTFKDASGALISADAAAEFQAVDTGEDRSNLFGIAGAITVDGLAGKGDGWAQIGYLELTEEQLAALQAPGSVVEISYTSESGNIWMGLSGENWLRIGVGDCDGSGQGYSYYNDSCNIAQIPYEEIVKVCGDDPSAWDKSIFIESDTAFEVFSVKIGQQAPSIVVQNAIDLGIAGTGDGWAQIGYQELTEEQFALLSTPGSVVEVSYTSESGEMWIGLSGNNWLRIGVGNSDGSGSVDAITNGSTCYVTYDMIAEVCGDDPSAWDKAIFAESDSKFEVYSIKIGTAAEIVPNNRQVDLGIEGKGDGWAQIGYVELTDEQFELLKTPGSVVVVSYTSDDGDLWIGLSGNNWLRVGVGNADGSGSVDAVTDGSKCYVTYDMIAAVCGDDPSAWDKSIFVESDTAFEVFSVKIGQGISAQ
ncbi:MAG: hypothetical protein IKR61_09795 [Lachnospiraceae bacterium]|nr:hypothetical protein [Lachnospiraceae bacterium]